MIRRHTTRKVMTLPELQVHVMAGELVYVSHYSWPDGTVVQRTGSMEDGTDTIDFEPMRPWIGEEFALYQNGQFECMCQLEDIALIDDVPTLVFSPILI